MMNQPFIVPAVLLALLSIPLILGLIPPNRFYGMRTEKTLSDASVWYAANRFGGWALIFSGLTYFGWGEIYSLFPATAGDLFGRQFATTNYGLLYTAKGTASLLVPFGNVLQESTGSWIPIFGLSVAFDLIAAVLAITLLRSWHHAHVARSMREPEAVALAAPPHAA